MFLTLVIINALTCFSKKVTPFHTLSPMETPNCFLAVKGPGVNHSQHGGLIKLPRRGDISWGTFLHIP